MEGERSLRDLVIANLPPDELDDLQLGDSSWSSLGISPEIDSLIRPSCISAGLDSSTASDLGRLPTAAIRPTVGWRSRREKFLDEPTVSR